MGTGGETRPIPVPNGIAWATMVITYILAPAFFATMASTLDVSRLHKLIPVYSFYSYWRIKDCRIFYLSLANTMIEPKKIFGNFRKLSLASREDSRETRAISVKKFPNIFLARKSSIQEGLIKNHYRLL